VGPSHGRDELLWWRVSNAVYPDDLVSADDFTWNGWVRQSGPTMAVPTGTRVLNVVEVRPYTLAEFPVVHDSRPTAGAVPSPDGAPHPY
jgi:hypothetical protein